MKKRRKKMLLSFLMACFCNGNFLYSMSFVKRVRDNVLSFSLMRACATNKKLLALLLIKAGVNIEKKDHGGFSPLICACEEGHKEVVRLLLAYGANIEAKDNDGRTPLIYACEEDHKEIVELLLSNGANTEVKDENGETPLIEACSWGRREIVKLLLANGVNIEAKDKWDRTPLICACRWGPEEVVQLLLEKGANIEAKDDDSKTSLDYMLEDNKTKLAEILIEHGADICNLYKSKNAEQFETACKQYAKLNTEIEELKKNIGANKNSVKLMTTERRNKINNLILDTQTPLFAKQSALAYLLKYHKSFPDELTKETLLSYYETISFNYRFFNDDEFKQAIEFAIKEEAKDKFGRSVLAVALFDRHNIYRDRLLSHLIGSTDLRESLNVYFGLNKKEKTNNFIDMLRLARKKEEKQRSKFLMRFALVSDTLRRVEYGAEINKNCLPYEIVGNIMSFMQL